MDDPIHILALETSGRLGSAAALGGTGKGIWLFAQTALSGAQRTAESLAPAVRQMLTDVGWPANSIKLVAVAIGPGSFTGLRIGVTMAKALAYAVGAEVVGVNTLDVLAAQAPPSSEPLWTVLDAQRQELFAAKYSESGETHRQLVHEPAILSQESWLAGLTAGDRVTGPALSRLESRLPAGVQVVARDLWLPMAAAVGEVGWAHYLAGQRDDLWQLTPMYYRASAAEEKLRS
jgi:tRNA threonylcarbamoyladenosine biosynthesis protein TsaB